VDKPHTIVHRGPRIHKPRISSAPTEHPTTHDLAWFAGIFEGEGGICKAKQCHYGQGIKLTVTQKDEWVTTRLRALFGGSLTVQNERINSMTGKPATFSRWVLSGQRAFILTQTVFHLMSPRRREQFEKAWAERMDD
jgi:hypothetical protein